MQTIKNNPGRLNVKAGNVVHLEKLRYGMSRVYELGHRLVADNLHANYYGASVADIWKPSDIVPT